ncbi:MAG: tripartite tricarboxylate transporter substrate binding protein [Burkholderiales bacterium]|nr:tripartite tricarboxylate transporter substrate binding protein [Burkholderiales bacterium]
MTPDLKRAVRPWFAAIALLVVAGAPSAQPYPSRPIRWIVPFAPGGGLDIITRAYAPHLGNSLGQPLVVENRPANAGILALELVARSAPDGYTLLTFGPSTLVNNRYIYADIKYDAEKDFAPVTMLADAPIALYVNASVPARTLGEFIALSRQPGSKLNYGAPGHGHIFHLAMELLKERTGADIQFVPYKGSAPMNQDLVAGNIQAAFNPVVRSLLSLVRAGKIRALAAGGDQRLRDLPEVPTAAEQGVRDYYAVGGFALYATGGTPRDIVARINQETVAVSRHPEVVKVHDAQNLLIAVGAPEELAARQKREHEIWAPLIKRLGIKAQ